MKDVCDRLEGGSGYNWQEQTKGSRDLITQSVISVVLGLVAFLAFCVLRPRWTTLYAARKKQKNSASSLPELPDTFLGWIPVLYRITEREVLGSAGLDAFVFLAFFKMAIKFLAVTFFFSLVVMRPINVHFGEDKGHNYTLPDACTLESDDLFKRSTSVVPIAITSIDYEVSAAQKLPPTNFLWMYVVFIYFFSGFALYLIVTETKRIIRIRQDYLGTQSSLTDRTIRLSGIPPHLRSEEKIKETIEKLEIGKVECVMLCKDLKELDGLMAERMTTLRRLEESWTVHLGHRRVEGNLESSRTAQPGHFRAADAEDESSGLLTSTNLEQNHVMPYARSRPSTRIWFGFLNLQSRRIDAIDYYEEKLRKIDERIKSARKKDFESTSLAFVTLDSTAACQMAVQAVMDPEPVQLVANLAPAPVDVVWQNTYLSRTNRMTRAWSITLVIILLTVFWSLLLVPLAGLLNLQSICKVWPQLAISLDSHLISKSLVQTGLPTLLISLLNVLVPYLYNWLANLQGMTSQGDVELSVISKNFFFTFFNLFVVFTIFGTASNAYAFFSRLGLSLNNTTCVAYLLATSLQNLGSFYINLIVLQGLGLFPFRLLEFGAVALYPISLIGAKTPRDYAELVQPPVFSYGFYLPQTILIFIICTVYSVLPDSWLVSLFGLVYFLIGSFVYKYQLLYAMDHRQHSTGRGWSIICNRILVGLAVFQLAMGGILTLRAAPIRAALIAPLLVGTLWFIYYYQKTYEPLMKFIALRSLHHEDGPDVLPMGEPRYESEMNQSEETGLRYVNPSMVISLEDAWIAKQQANGSSHIVNADGEDNV